MKKITIISFIAILFLIAGCAKKGIVSGDKETCPPNLYAKMPGYRSFTVADKTFHDGYLKKLEYIPSSDIGFKITKTLPGIKKYVDGVYQPEQAEKVQSVTLCEGTPGVFHGLQGRFLLIKWIVSDGKEDILAFQKSAYSSEYKFFGWYDQSTDKVIFVKLGYFPVLKFVSQIETHSEEELKEYQPTII